jgi:pimeloyl-ACP methyl ester carboxylesterase
MSFYFPKLDIREEHFLIPGPHPTLQLFLRYLPALRPNLSHRRSVLYVHGATFPSALSIAHRFDGRSWRDALCDAGFGVWGLDFYGFGLSDRYSEMSEPAEAQPPLGLAVDAEKQLAAAVHFILEHETLSRLSFISHSWGSMPLGRFAGTHPSLVDRWLLFAPIAWREKTRYLAQPTSSAWRTIGVEDQWQRFAEDVPPNEPPVLPRDQFDEWALEYLASDPKSSGRNPAAVQIPSGPSVEILRAWQGELAYDPGLVQAPIAIVRGAWDGLVTDRDAGWLFDAFSRVPNKRDIKISRATHLMHLEAMRPVLWQESIGFLSGGDQSVGTLRATYGDHSSPNDQGTIMADQNETIPSIPGYNPGSSDVAHSPISMHEWEEMKQSAFFSDEDVTYLRLSYDVLKDQAEDLVKVWRGIIMSHPHLRAYDENPLTGEIDKAYATAVGKRFTQWVIDTAKAEYDQKWLDYQYEIGLRHHRTKKNMTDGGHTAEHIRARDLIAFAAATVAPMKPHLAKGGHSAEVVNRMYDAWWKSMILQVTLWSQPYMKEGDF